MKLLVKTAVTALKKRRWCGNFAMRVGAIFMGGLNGVFWFKLGGDRRSSRSPLTSSYKFSNFWVDLVMAQVDRTMQILSGGYLCQMRSNKGDRVR